MPPAKLAPGTVVAGRFRIKRVLGEGGMAIVYVADDIHLQRDVAMKVLLPSLAGNANAAARFVREARAAFRVQGEHAVRVHDVGKTEGGAPYIVMELLEGRDLGFVLNDAGRLPVETAVDYVIQACEALAQAHAQGIVHRDIKPENLFVTQRATGSEVVKVLDFGLATAAEHDAREALTETHAMMGSPVYMSPEQIRDSHEVDARTDIWSLGITLYEMVTGQLPFDGPSMGDVLVRVTEHAPLPPQLLVPDVPDALSDVILRCLEKDPSRRYRDLAQLGAALERTGLPCARGARERLTPVVPSKTQVVVAGPEVASDAHGTVTKTESVSDAGVPRPRRSRIARSASAVGVAALVALTIFVTVLRSDLVRAAAAMTTPSVAAVPTQVEPRVAFIVPVLENADPAAPRPKLARSAGKGLARATGNGALASPASATPTRLR